MADPVGLSTGDKITSEHITTAPRPIAVLEGRAVVGRPVEKILELL